MSIVHMYSPAPRFVITDSPNDKQMEAYVNDFCQLRVEHLVRASTENLYSTDALLSVGIKVHDFVSEDGGVPKEEVLLRWLDFVEEVRSWLA